MKETISLTASVVALVVSCSLLLFPNTVTNVVEQLGANPGSDHFVMNTFHGGVVDGGEIIATSTVTNSTLLARDLMVAKQIDMTLTQGDGTLTLPASTTIAGWLSSPGGTRTVIVRNATTTAGTDLTVAVGTGMTMKLATSSPNAIALGDTDGKNSLFLTFVRQANRDFIVYVSGFKD